MKNILICVDGSAYSDHSYFQVSKLYKKIGVKVDLLHVAKMHSDYEVHEDDHTGTIALDARHTLLEKLSKLDEERGRVDMQKGKLILEHANEVLKSFGVAEEDIKHIHRRGHFVDTLKEFEKDADLIVLGKRGEDASRNADFMGSNLEIVLREISKPVLLSSTHETEFNRFVIAYDGKEAANKVVSFVCENIMFKGLQCHLLAVDSKEGAINTQDAEVQLKEAGFEVVVKHEVSNHVDEVVKGYIKENDISLLVTGAYSHSKLRTVLFGSTTAHLIQESNVPMLIVK